MDLFSQKIERSELKEGDHVYAWRKHLPVSHHGIFIGEGKIIHFGNPNRGAEGCGFLESVREFANSSGGNENTTCSIPFCKLEKVAGSGVVMSCIDCFLKHGSLHRFKYQVGHEFLLAKTIGGTCTTAESDPPEEVIYRATYLHENGYVKYDLQNNNCEDFALYCKTGLWSTDKEYQGRSSQANMFHRTSKDKLHDEGKGGRVRRYAKAIPKTFSKREEKDLGVRKDVVKVPVEMLSSFCASLSE